MYNCTSPLTIVLGNLPTFARLEVTRLLRAQPDLGVIGVAASVEELPVLLRRRRPDLLIVGDSQLLVLERVAKQLAVPMLLSTSSSPMRGMLQEIARWGIYDYISQPPAAAQPAYQRWQAEVLRKIRAVRPKPAAVVVPAVDRPAVPVLPRGIVVVGASTGGTQAVEQLVSDLKTTLSVAIVVAVHLPAHFTASFVGRLRRVAPLPVVTGQAGTCLEAGKIVVVPGGRTMVVRALVAGPWPVWQLAVAAEPNPGPDDPSVDLLMSSAASVAGRNTVGVVLTGLGRDGTLGAQAIRQQGGLVAVQDQASSAVFSMPGSVIRAGLATKVLALGDLPEYINHSAAQLRFNEVERPVSPAHAALR